MERLPKRPLPMKAWLEESEIVEWENWARNQLMAAGSDLLGKFSYLQVIFFFSIHRGVFQLVKYKNCSFFFLLLLLLFAFLGNERQFTFGSKSKRE